MHDLRKSRRIKYFCKHIGKAILRFNMIEDGDKIIIGVSGGKDSLSLCIALVERKKWVPINYELFAAMIEWKEYPYSEDQKKIFKYFFDKIGMNYKIIKATMIHPNFKKNFNCYICSRNRKRILFTLASEMGVNKIALGHSLDDVVETTLMNLFFLGEFSTMMPVQDFFQGKIKIIRPMCEVPEKEIIKISKEINLPTIQVDCPNKKTNKRILMKEIIARLSRVNKKTRENIYRAPWNINREYLPFKVDSDFSTGIKNIF